MSVGIVEIVVGAVAAATAGVLDGATPGRWLERLQLTQDDFFGQVLRTLGFALPGFGAVDLSAGQPAWARVCWFLAGMCGDAFAYIVPYKALRRHASTAAPAQPVHIRRAVPKSRT